MTDESEPNEGCAEGQASWLPPDTAADGEDRTDADEVIDIPLGVPVSDEELRAMKESARRPDPPDDG